MTSDFIPKSLTNKDLPFKGSKKQINENIGIIIVKEKYFLKIKKRINECTKLI